MVRYVPLIGYSCQSLFINNKSVVLSLLSLCNGVYHLLFIVQTSLYNVSSKQGHIRHVARKDNNELDKAKEQTKLEMALLS